MTFRLLEKTRRVEFEPEERTYSWKRWDYVATGLLRIEITDAYWHRGRKQWSDGKNQKLEDQLGLFLVGAYEAALTEKKQRLKREEGARGREEERRQRQEVERRQKEEEARRCAFEDDAHSWRKSQELQAYICEVERRAAERKLQGEEREAFERWLSWAREHANRIDPLEGSLPFEEQP